MKHFELHPNQIMILRDQLLEGRGAFGLASMREPAIDVKTLHAKIAELKLVNDFLSGALGKAGVSPSVKR